MAKLVHKNFRKSPKGFENHQKVSKMAKEHFRKSKVLVIRAQQKSLRGHSTKALEFFSLKKG